jgi:hypothetical protein
MTIDDSHDGLWMSMVDSSVDPGTWTGRFPVHMSHEFKCSIVHDVGNTINHPQFYHKQVGYNITINHSTMWAALVISWFITPSKCNYKYHTVLLL